MRRAFKTLALIALGAVVLALAGGQKNRARVLGWLKRTPPPDATVAARVLAKLERITANAEAIQASTEHGCVVLTGDVLTAERSAIVHSVAKIEGVDAVVDLMTEHRSLGDMPRHLRRFERRPSRPGTLGRKPPASPW
jgi:cell division septation protein DedD